eukprot:78424-Alexandrium_andersonii.AAC.1
MAPGVQPPAAPVAAIVSAPVAPTATTTATATAVTTPPRAQNVDVGGDIAVAESQSRDVPVPMEDEETQAAMFDI